MKKVYMQPCCTIAESELTDMLLVDSMVVDPDTDVDGGWAKEDGGFADDSGIPTVNVWDSAW